jgi:hypothetical protein
MNGNDIKKLQEAYALRGVEIHQLHARVTSLEKENARLKELLRLQQERLFGKKSEIGSSILNPATEPTSLSSPKITVVTSHTRQIPPRGNRQFNSHQLPKYPIFPPRLGSTKTHK